MTSTNAAQVAGAFKSLSHEERHEALKIIMDLMSMNLSTYSIDGLTAEISSDGIGSAIINDTDRAIVAPTSPIVPRGSCNRAKTIKFMPPSLLPANPPGLLQAPEMENCFGEQRFARLPGSVRVQSQPNPCELLYRVWDLCRAMRGTVTAQEAIDPSLPRRGRLRQLLEQDDSDDRGLWDTLQMRYRAFQFALEYIREREKVIEEDSRPQTKRARRLGPGEQPLQLRRVLRPKRDRALDNLLRDCYDLKSAHALESNDWKRVKAKYWLDIGLPMSELVGRLGYTAFIAPGLLINQESLKNIGRRQVQDFGDYVDRCYTNFKEELDDVSPRVKSLVCSGLPEQLLRIETLTFEQLSGVGEFSLAHWLGDSSILDWGLEITDVVSSPNRLEENSMFLSTPQYDDDPTELSVNELSSLLEEQDNSIAYGTIRRPSAPLL